LHEFRTEGCTTRAMDYAAQNGHIDVVEWLHEFRVEGCTTDAMDWAAENGHLEVVKFLKTCKNNSLSEI
jgi:ankyrin repeat protein